jgi:hypothetical protein
VEEEYTLGKSFTERNRSFDGWTGERMKRKKERIKKS